MWEPQPCSRSKSTILRNSTLTDVNKPSVDPFCGGQGIYDTLKECAAISKSAGGIGLSIHNIRGTGSYIRGTNGNSNGIVPMLRVFNDTARYVDQVPGAPPAASPHMHADLSALNPPQRPALCWRLEPRSHRGDHGWARGFHPRNLPGCSRAESARATGEASGGRRDPIPRITTAAGYS